MKVLYAIQGTGNGHVSRALEIVPLLRDRVDLDVMVSGIQADIELPFEVKYRQRGLSFIFGKKGGVDVLATLQNIKLFKLRREILELPVHKYDVVISDFEPISAWAARRAGVLSIGLSHQAAVIDAAAPKPRKRDRVGEAILRHYAPTDLHYGFHFKSYSPGMNTPVIRKQVRWAHVKNKGHYTVYLPSYGDKEIVEVLSYFKHIKWDVFSKFTRKPSSVGNVNIRPVSNDDFVKSMVESEGVLCGAGFETPSEVLHLGKKLMVIPMKAQYEQLCNAMALFEMGVPVINHLNNRSAISHWICSDNRVNVDYTDSTSEILDQILVDAGQQSAAQPLRAS